MTGAPDLRLVSGAPPIPDGARIAAIDIGSNSIRLMVADVSSAGAITVIDEMKAAPRLGAGIAETGALAPESMDKAIEALQRMATLAKQLGARRIEAVATSAVRDATNRELFLHRVKRETGLVVRTLAGEDEARLSFRSALAHFDLGVGRAVVMDIGGGSLELAMSADGLLERLASLPLGAIRLTEQFGGPSPRRKDIKRMRKFIRAQLKAPLPVREWRGAQVIGSGGTFTNLAGILLSRQSITSAQTVHGTRIPRTDLEHIFDTLSEMSPEERRQIPGLNPERADIIVAGLAVAAEVVARVDARGLTASRYGIREGLLLETARVRATVADPGEARDRSVREFAERCNYEAPHAQHVQRLALQLFDSIGPRLGCDPADRQLLADAALLHDIGYHISYDRHHKHSYHLIVHAELLGMAPDEQVIVANVARYHRGARPRKSHGNFGILDAAARKRVKRLAAILRVADGFDRGHVGAVERIKVRWLKRAIRMTPVMTPRAKSLRLELWSASRKADLLEKLAKRPVEVVSPDGEVVRNDGADEAE